jgi:hypothetical protein
MAVIIRRTKGIEPIGFSDLFAEEEASPTAWNAAHVGLRLVEAFTTVLKMPGGRTGYRSLWPAYMYEFDDLVAQAEQGELEITQRTQNKVRIAPSTPEITTMEKALAWPMKFLSAKHPQICEAVNMISLAHALGRDAGWCAKKRGGFADDWRQRHDRGCEDIALGLVLDRMGVF